MTPPSASVCLSVVLRFETRVDGVFALRLFVLPDGPSTLPALDTVGDPVLEATTDPLIMFSLQDYQELEYDTPFSEYTPSSLLGPSC